MSYWFEDIAPAFTDLVNRAYKDHEAPNFAGDLALMGARPEPLRTMAGRWREWGFEPESFADELDALADIVQRIAPRERG